MIIRIDDDGTVQLLEAEDLRRFSIGMPDTPAARAVLATVARPDGRQHAWIAPESVRALAGGVPSGWADEFTATIAYATTRGWMDGDGAVRAHIVYD